MEGVDNEFFEGACTSNEYLKCSEYMSSMGQDKAKALIKIVTQRLLFIHSVLILRFDPSKAEINLPPPQFLLFKQGTNPRFSKLNQLCNFMSPFVPKPGLESRSFEHFIPKAMWGSGGTSGPTDLLLAFVYEGKASYLGYPFS